MSELRRAVGDCLAMRRALGFSLVREGRWLMDFVGHLEQAGSGHVTTELAVTWATRTRADVNPAGEGVEKTFDGVESSKNGKTSKSEMNLGDGSCRAKVTDAQSECRVELCGIEQIEKGALGIDAGGDSMDADFFAIGEYESHDGAVFDADVPDFGVGANFRAGLARGFRKRTGEGAEPAVREGSRTNGMRVGSGSE